MIPIDCTGLEVLGIAIRSEIEAAELYREIAGRVEDPTAKERFHLLAAEEDRHRGLLARKYEELYPDVPLRVPPMSASGRDAGAVRADLSLCDVLELAIGEESASQEFYLEAIGRMRDPNGESMLRYLAGMEYTHRMTLTAEYEMLRRYPHYYDACPEPWREETGMRVGRRQGV
jgi:rubrerythrin